MYTQYQTACFSVLVCLYILITFLIPLSLSYTEADSPTTNSAKTVSSSNKRRWDQETTDEPFHKKADTWQAIRQEEYPEISDKIVTDIDSSAKTPEVDEEEKSSDVNKEAPKKMSGFSIGIKKNKASPAPIKITLGSQVNAISYLINCVMNTILSHIGDLFVFCKNSSMCYFVTETKRSTSYIAKD